MKGELVVNDKEWFSHKCVEATDDVENEQIVKSLYKALKEHPKGVGMAANQLGYDKRIAVILRKTDEDIVLINPVVVSVSKKTSKQIEGCLSFPDAIVATRRHSSITLQRQPGCKEETFTGFDAVVIQHELGHLDGKTMWDVEFKKKRSNFTPKKKKRKKRR